MEFNELMQKWVNTDYKELAEMAKIAVAKLMPACKAVDEQYKGNYMLASLVLTAIGADGVLTALESKLLGDVLGLDQDGVQRLIKMYDSRMADLADHFVDNLGTDVKADALMLITAIAAVDEKISREETGLIKKLLA